jgi:hypothetical protein
MSRLMPGETAERLRADIDAGHTGDKVPASDPAMAPLGTDEEAAGAPPSAEAVAQARGYETSTPVAQPQPRKGPGYAWVLISIIIIFAVASLAVPAFLR